MEKEKMQAGQETIEEYKSTADSGQERMDQQGDQIDASVEEVLIKHLENMFELDNLKRHYYLIKHLNMNLEIEPNYIFNERSVLGITSDPAVIEAALLQCKNVEYTKGSVVRLKLKAERRTLLVKQIKMESQGDFYKLVQEISNTDEKLKDVKFDYDFKNNCVSLTLSSENAAIRLFSELQDKIFEGQSVDCMIKDEVPSIELLELIKSNKKNYRGYNNRFNYYQPPQTMMMMDPYAYGYYPVPFYTFPNQYPTFVKPTPYIRKNRENYRDNYYGGGAGYESNPNSYGNRNRNNYSNASTGADTPTKSTEEDKQGYQKGGQQGDNYNKGGFRQKKRYDYGGGEYRQGRDGKRNYNGQKDDKKKRISSKDRDAITSVNSGGYPPLG